MDDPDANVRHDLGDWVDCDRGRDLEANLGPQVARSVNGEDLVDLVEGFGREGPDAVRNRLEASLQVDVRDQVGEGVEVAGAFDLEGRLGRDRCDSVGRVGQADADRWLGFDSRDSVRSLG